ncbi:MAG: 3-hydroxyacyl-CoA dehydrogenase family protein [Planctomycetota bacterium]
MDIGKVGVLGCGLMGSGIAHVSLQAGHAVAVVEVDPALLEKGVERVRFSFERLVRKKRMSEEERDAVLARLAPTVELADLADCDLVIEAVTEDLDLKKRLFQRLGAICPRHTIFASNTSSFPVAEVGEASGRPERMVGLHFFNPPELMRLVEVIRTSKTLDEVFETAERFAISVGKTPIRAKDLPGFVVNRLLVPTMLEAIRMVERGEATIEDVDTGMTLGCGHPMGPFTLLDYVGLDTTLAVVEGWHQRFPRQPLFDPPELLRKMVQEGRLGRKSGRGFYEWEGDRRK